MFYRQVYYILGQVYCILGQLYCILGQVYCILGQVYCILGQVYCILGQLYCMLGQVYCILGQLFCILGLDTLIFVRMCTVQVVIRGTAIYWVGVKASQLNLPSLMPLSIACWGRLQLGDAHYCK